jgi:bla regulator protein blaR1
MTERIGGKLSFGRKLLLAAAGITAVAGPLVFGLVEVPQIHAQKTQTNDVRVPSFEVASIKVDKSRTPLPWAHLYGDRFNATVTARGLIGMAYGHEHSSLSSDQISGGPDWIKSELFDIDAKVEDSLVEGEWKTLPFEKKWDQVLRWLDPCSLSASKSR